MEIQTRQAMYYGVTYRRLSLTIVAAKKQQVLYVFILSVFLVIEHVKRMRRICELSGSTTFSSLFHKRQDLQKKS
jgi:type IV secretory pathway VirB3-like protein